MTIRSKLFIGFILLILIFIVNFFVNQSLSQEVVKNTASLRRSETVIRNSNQLHKDIINMQSGFRGFLLTNQEIFLTSYYEGLKAVPPLMNEQREMVSSTYQHQRLDSIMLLHGMWLEYANTIISARKDSVPEARKRYSELFETQLKKGVGKKLNDQIEEKILAFDNDEYHLIKERREVLELSITETNRISLILMLFSIALGLISSFWVVKTITRRISEMADLSEEISKGNFKTIEDNKKDELKKLSESLNKMSETLNKNFNELTKKNKELDQFTYVVSRDLKAHIKGIDAITKWMEEDHEKETMPGIKKNIDLIKGRTSRLENMIDGLLEYARVGRIKKGPEKVDVKRMLNELTEVVVPSSFSVIIEGDMPVIITEKLRLEQVFYNLIGNAVKHNNKTEGKINISSRELGDYCEFSVMDNGPGIQTEDYNKIFMIFQTLQARDAYESTGLGLAIVKKIIEEQKGVISVDSVLGEGTTFKFTWPKKSATEIAYNYEFSNYPKTQN
jgi:signal transduction histidine kinase